MYRTNLRSVVARVLLLLLGACSSRGAHAQDSTGLIHHLQPGRARVPVILAPRHPTTNTDHASQTSRGLLGMRRQESPHPAVVRVTATQGNVNSHGSGTLVGVRQDYGLVVTNWHVVRDAMDSVTVTFPDGYCSPAKVLRTDQDWDLAALLIWRSQVEPVSITDHPPQPGDLLTIAGYGSGKYRESTGYCTQYVAPGLNMPCEMVELSAQARQGDSGGPIMNEAGEVAGVLFGSGRGRTSGSYAGRVRLFLDGVWPAIDPPGESEMIAVEPQENDTHVTQSRCLAAIAREHLEPFQDSDGGDLENRTVHLTPSETIQEITWKDLTGKTFFEQVKSLFAMIGFVVILIHLVKAIAE